MATESKAQRIERIKEEKDGLDVLQNILAYAQSGEAVHPEDIDRFKWYGLYTQNRNLQDPEDETLYFMLRIKLESGYLNTEQVSAIGKISKEFGQNSGDLTTRQDIQLHWIKLKDLPEIFERLDRVGLSTLQAAGDCPRNIVSCPVNGIDHDQIDDVRDIVSALNDLYRGNREFSNLPRKFKVAVSGCSKHCISHEIQDLTFTAVKRPNDDVVFLVSVGGGIASNRRFANTIGYVNRSNIVRIAEAVTTLYRDFGCRDNRSKARLGHLVELWGVRRFVSEVEYTAGVKLENYDTVEFTPYPYRNHFGIFPATTEGTSFIGCAVMSGRISGENLIQLGEILTRYGAHGISLTTTQNLVVQGVSQMNADAMAETLETLGIYSNPSAFTGRTQACTGLDFCKYAVSETKDTSLKVIDYLNKQFPKFQEPISISINGCPNSCAHPQIADLGFVGAMVKQEEFRVNGFDMLVGGYLEGNESRFALKTRVKVTPDEIAPLITSLIREYEISSNTNFGKFLLEKYQHASPFSTPS
ncbi:MAG: nitrite/sulfite reductase [Sulfuricurvum sp.]|jgi:sulfite reductase (ferredoxin)|uniref:nitrite/sulfite reductase n=1 Tax=Sulfuricurvum sp. TaxID=2025608 RepID=UPI0026001FE4|nr:nitrite/sulfite reductase [Sulfuricurvum sp.]MCK9373857.1 nitrite/sulfite reductase [Sulfuricurvum sp.]